MLTVSTSGRPSYHHGDLRAALVRAGLALLATRPADDLSLREVARSVGVSANAVYRGRVFDAVTGRKVASKHTGSSIGGRARFG